MDKRSSVVLCTQYLENEGEMNPHLIILLSLAAVISAANEPIAIVRPEQDTNPNGSYFTKWNRIVLQERNVQKNSGQKDKEPEEVHNSMTYIAPDEQKITFDWGADENGAIFEETHLLTPPEIPSTIQHVFDWMAAHPYQEERNKV